MPGIQNDGFPNDPIFIQLRRLATELPGVLFHDEYGIDAGYADVVSDVIHLRQVLREVLPSTAFNEQGCLRADATSVAFLATSQYYFIVSFLAIVALGGVCVPLSTGLNPKEALYFLNKAKATYILTDETMSEKAMVIRDHAQAQAGQTLHLIPITRSKVEASLCLPTLEINGGLKFSPTRGCLILFTSGTTALPKGVVLPRRLFYFEGQTSPPEVLYLASTPSHWIGGTGVLDSVLIGERLHMMKSGSGPAMLWDVLREGKVTDMSMSPTLLRELMEYYDETICALTPDERDRYVNGARNLQTVLSSGSALSPSTLRFFTDIANVPIRNGYGLTEMGGGVTTAPVGSAPEEGYIGTLLPGVSVKLSEGDHGELLAKSPHMFTHYIGDEAATQAAFDDEGFYKTGDRVHRIGDKYYFDGRASSDWVRFHEYTIHVTELEQRLMDLPYISEAHVLPVRDHEAGGLVAALLRVRKQYHNISLQKIRADLAANNVAAYKLPVLLRVLQKDESVPLTASGKTVKRESLWKYFDISEYMPENYSVEGVEYWGNKLDLAAPTRLYDWGGL